MRRVILLVARLYPPWWRARYGAEFEELLREEEPTLAAIVDVVGHAMTVRVRGWAGMQHGGSEMIDAPQRLALVGLALMTPTVVLVTVAVLKYMVGFAGPFDAIEPAMTPIVTHPVGETFFVLAPYVSLLMAAIPVTRLELGWRAGRLGASVRVAAPVLNVGVAALSVLIAGFMLLYWVAENL